MFKFFDNGETETQNADDHESDKEESSESRGGDSQEESRGESHADEDEEEEVKREEEVQIPKNMSSKPRVSRLPTLPPLPENFPMQAAIIRKDSKALVDAIHKLPPCLDPLTPFRERPINKLDHHGYTALTLAVLTSWTEGVKILLDHGASPGVTSSEGWTSINEAVSTSQREILRMLFVANMKLMKEMLALRAPRVRQQLAQKKDFYVEIDWKFTSWIPFVSRFCPSDTFRIWKKGCDVRVDISLIDFNQFKWERGHISFIFKTTADGVVEFHIVNHVEKTRQKTTKSDEVKTEEKDIDNSVEVLLQSELFCPELVTNELKITQNTTWLGYPKNVEVNGAECASYTVANLIILARQRNSHVPKEVKEALKRKKNMLKEKASSTNNNEDNLDQLFASENELDQESNNNLLDSEKEKDSTRGRHLSTASAAGKKSRSPGPFAGKKQKLSEYVKKYEYPKWQPPPITIEQYFKLAKPEPKIAGNTLGLTQIVEEDKENDPENSPNFLTNPVMSSPMASPRGGSLLSRVFGKKNKHKRKKSKNKSEKNASNEDQEDRDDPENNDEDNENEQSEASSEREWENSTSQTENDQTEEFDEKSIYQQSTFTINRSPVRKTMKTFKLMLAISEKFGLTVDEMVTILDAAAPTSKLARKLKEFLEIKMPPGFPVQLELPIYHVLKATVTFQNFKEMEVKDEIFAIPEDYLLVEKDDVGKIEDDN